jgi:hypothetical protein
MKNQYFGDVNDYLKYSLLRLLGGNGQFGIAVCWALTQDDRGLNGNRTKYLERPSEWGGHDSAVFSLLREEVLRKGNRSVSAIEQADVLRNCRYFGEFISDEVRQRELYFEAFFKFAEGADFVFFDPDNGLNVKSVARGGRGSSKYVYQDEIERAYHSGHTVLLYQHFPRKPRDSYIRGVVGRFTALRGMKRAISYSSPFVVFLLLPQPRHEKLLLSNTREVARNWGDRIRIGNHPTLDS